MILGARNNGFIVLFPNNFFSKEISEKYKPYYKNLLLPYETIEDFMSSTIQSIKFNGFTVPVVSQIRPLGKVQEFHSSKPIADLFDRKFTLTFKLSDAYLNYFIFLDNAFSYLDQGSLEPTNTRKTLSGRGKPTTKDSQGITLDPIRLILLNSEGYAVSSIIFNHPILTGMTQISLSYSDTAPKFTTFDVSFQYFNFDIESNFDSDLNYVGV
jgi:hypothetical protein